MSSSTFGKLEADIEMKAPADQVFEFIMRKPYQLSNVSPDKVLSCELLEGDWGEEGSVILWSTYPNGGKIVRVGKELIETVDYEKRSATFIVTEGHMMQYYKSFKSSFHVTATATGEREETSCCLHWTLEYEKLHDEVPEPEAKLQLIVGLAKDLDAFLTTQAK